MTEDFLMRKFNAVLLTAEEVAEVLRISTKTFQNGVSAGRYPELRPQSRTLYHVANVAAYVDSLKLVD